MAMLARRHGMAAAAYVDLGFIRERRQVPPQRGRALGEAAEHVKLGDGGGGGLHGGDVGLQIIEDCREHLFFPRQRPALTRQRFVFESLQLRQDVTLCVLQRLS